MVEPVHPDQRGMLHVIDYLPEAILANDFRLVEPVDRLSQCVVVRVADTTHRRSQAS